MKWHRQLGQFLVATGVSLGIAGFPAQAQVSPNQVNALVEALRQAAPQTGKPNDNLYSDWQVQPGNIPRWSKSCIGRELTPTQFAASPTTARGIIVCVMRDVLRDEYRAAGNNETLAVRRAAAWWMTGDPNRYNTGDTATYTQRVLTFYQRNQPRSQSVPPSVSQKPATPAAERSTPYDRYMLAGYDASRRKSYPIALLYFKRALDERPKDTYATQAIRNVESYQSKPQSTRPPATRPPATTPPTTNQTATITQQQAIALITRWLQSKPEIFAPPFNEYRLNDLTTGELLASLVKPEGVLPWLKQNQAYYRYGVQKIEAIEQFAANQNRATIEVRLMEDRTLYRNGQVDPRLTDFSAQRIRYSLEQVNGQWKISDYKTVDGSLLERSVLSTTTSVKGD